MRKRMIDPEIWDSALAKGWTTDDFTVMVGAISAADDEGRGRVSMIYRNVSSMMSEKKFKKSLQNLSDSITIYQKIYFFLPKFKNYQWISKPKASKFPEPNIQEIKDLTPEQSKNIPSEFQADSDLVRIESNRIESNSNRNGSGKNVDNSNGKLQTSNLEISLPLLTEISDYAPIDYENREHVTEAVKNLLSSFCNIEQPDKATITSFTNVVMNTNQVKNRTAFEYLFNTFNEFHTYPEEKRNLGYLYKRLKGRIDDALIEARERKAKLNKQNEKQQSAAVDNEIVEQLTNNMKIN